MLEKFLDDDSDMMDMNLTALEAERQQDAARAQLLSMHRAAMSGRDTPMDVPLTVGFEVRGLGSTRVVVQPVALACLLARGCRCKRACPDSGSVQAG